MKITGFLWLADIVEKLEGKHNVRIDEIKEVFAEGPYFRFVEKGHHPDENVYSAMGQTNTGRYLNVFFVYKKDGRILVLSARNMTNAERRRYERR